MTHRILLAVLVVAFAGFTGAGGQEFENADKTLSPYFLVLSADEALDQLPLLSTTAAVDIAGVIADVRVIQKYKNDGKKPIEAIYVFPASTRAAVYAMKMTIGERTIVADIKEREQARQEYEAAREAGQTASLLEQQRPNVFQMNVANIMPGDTIVVELSYTELLVPEARVYEFVYPTVVGPRYSNAPERSAPDSEGWIKNPYTTEGKPPAYEFGIEVNLAAGLPIQDMTCPSHKTSISYDGLAFATATLDESEQQGGNRDFVLRYRLAGGQVQSGLLLYEGKDENFFLTLLQPPKRVETDQIPAREYIFIVDVSGSMYGFPLDVSKRLLRDLITNLRPTDRFNVLLFAGGNSVMSEASVPASEKNIARAVQLIDDQEGGGATELLPALKRALALPRAEGTSRTVVIATDGYVTVETEAFDLIRASLGDANMFAFGIGSGVNRYIIEGMARVGMGEPFVVTDESEAGPKAKKFREYIQRPVLANVRVEYRGFEVYDVEPLTIPDVLAERPIIVFGKWRGEPKGTIKVTGRTGRGKYSKTLDVGEVTPLAENAALRFLWARHRIQVLADYNNLQEDEKRVAEVTRLGLKYSLLTAYTSFVAIDSDVRNPDGSPALVRQPQPLPQGVSNYAVGGAMAKSSAGWIGQGVTRRRAPMASPTVDFEACDELTAEPDPGAGFLHEVSMVQVTVTPASGQPAVADAVEELLPEIELAYDEALGRDPSLAGRQVLKLVIGADGTVRSVSTIKNDLDAELAKAVAELLEGIELADPTGGELIAYVTLEYVR